MKLEVNLILSSKNVVCYFQNSNGYQLAPPEDLNASLCTHINYAFVTIDNVGNLTVQNEKLDIGQGLYERVVNLKTVNPALKVLLSVGDVTAKVFSAVAADVDKRRNFVESAKYFLTTYSFDGLDIDWEKPTADDADNFISLLSELRKEFDNCGWVLTAAVYPNPDSGYNVTEMAKYLDIFNVMCYNYYGPWSAHTGQNAPLFASSVDSSYEKNYLNVAASIDKWLNAGAPKEKLVVGIPFYGRSFTLEDPEEHGLHAPITGAGTLGTPSYRQICTGYNNWTTVWDDEQKNPYKYIEDQWLGYDDERSVREKVQYIMSLDLGGAMVWHIGADDLRGECGEKQGLLALINK
ncbi:hypothetical protein NQ318_000959, partial [Aromia moschata]